eukprot:EC822261.1.p1 GENE.EC822261.1~~EC822261.1.p1  ORF type:complete len:65 (+),score=7.86 EC822261.1:185-379(+)
MHKKSCIKKTKKKTNFVLQKGPKQRIFKKAIKEIYYLTSLKKKEKFLILISIHPVLKKSVLFFC